MRPLEVFWSFLSLGLTSFGGPLAHLGYFRKAFVTERKWLDEEAHAALVALAQAIPGPLFSFAAFLGAKAHLGLPASIRALLSLLALFLPGILFFFAALPFASLLRHPRFHQGLEGAGAGVVGLLWAALYDPLFLHAVDGRKALALALLLFGLRRLGVPPWALALLGATVGGVFL